MPSSPTNIEPEQTDRYMTEPPLAKHLCKLPRQRDTSKGELLASDVGPILRQLFTRADDLFGVLFFLTLGDELARGQVPE